MGFLYALLIVLVGYIAYRKQRNVIGWLVLAILILPLAIIGILLLKPLPNKEERTKQDKFSSFGVNFGFLGRIVIIIGITALFAFIGYIYTIMKYELIDRLNGNVMAHMFSQALMKQLDGNELDYDSVYSLTSLFISDLTSASYYMEMITKEQVIHQAILGGAIGLLLAIGIILISSNRNAKVTTSFVSKLKGKLQPSKQQIIFTVAVLVGSALILGNAAYFMKKAWINQDRQAYFEEVITDPVTGENLYDELYNLAYQFPANDYLFVMEGLSIYEANLTKDTFTFIGLLLGVAIVIYQFRKQK